MDFYLENGLLLLAQQIAQDQKDLYMLEELQVKSFAAVEENTVFRHDYTDTYDAEVARNQAEETNKDIVCDAEDMLGNCRDVSKEHDLENELAQTGSGAVSSLQNAGIAIMALFALATI